MVSTESGHHHWRLHGEASRILLQPFVLVKDLKVTLKDYT